MKVLTLECINGNYLRQEKDLFDGREETSSKLLQQMYKYLNCNMVDICEFNYKGVNFDVWFDEEFLLGNKIPVVTLILGELKPDRFTILCGNLLFAKRDEDGKMLGLSQNDIKLLWEFTDINVFKIREAFQRGLIKSK